MLSHSGMRVTALFSQAAGSGDMEQDSGCLAPPRHAAMDEAC